MRKLREDVKDLRDFLRQIATKYLPKHLKPAFKVSLHFMERLTVDRTDNLSKRWVSETITILFRYRLCEFLYLVELAEDTERINVQYQGKTIAFVKYSGNGGCGTLLTLTTCFKGVALNPTVCNYVLSLDPEDN